MRRALGLMVVLGGGLWGCGGSAGGSSTGSTSSGIGATTGLGTGTTSSSGSHGSTSAGVSSNGTGASSNGTGASSSSGGASSSGSAGTYQLAIAETSSISLYAVSPSGSSQAEGNFAAAGQVFALQWSPVSNQIGVVESAADFYASGSIDVYSTAGSSIASFTGLAFGWSPDGTQVVFSDENDQLRIGQVSSGSDSTPLEIDSIEEPAWAPAGSSRISYIDQSSNGYQYDPELIVAPTPGAASAQFVAADQVYSYLWSPDASRIAFLTQIQSAYYYSLCDLGVAQLTEVGVTSTSPLVQNLVCPTSVAWSPDGSRLGLAWQNLFVVSASAASVDFSSLSGLLAEPRDVYQLEWTPDGQYLGFLSSSESYYVGSSDFLLEPATGGSPLTVLSGIEGTTFDVHR